MFAIDYLAHAGGKEYNGHSFLKRFASQLRSAIPDLQIIEIKFLAQDNSTIVWQRTTCGTHKKTMKGISASGGKVEWTDMVVTRFGGEKNR